MYFNLSDFRVMDVIKQPTKEIIDYGVMLVGAPLEWDETEGEGIKIGVIDTGVDLNHQDLKNRIKQYANFTTDKINDVTDENGHGTHVSGIIAAEKNGIGIIGVAPNADLYIAKAFNKDGSANQSAIYKSVEWMKEKNVDIINMSFSSTKANISYHDLIRSAYNKGITIVCAAGNSGNMKGDTIGYPARYKETIAVTAVDINRKHADYSSSGPEADIAAAGTEIISCYPGNKYARLSGTSMAAPLISGSAAILHAKAKLRFKRRLTPDEMSLIMKMYSEDLGACGIDEKYGCGLFSFGRLYGSEKIVLPTKEMNDRIQSVKDRKYFDEGIFALMLLFQNYK